MEKFDLIGIGADGRFGAGVIAKSSMVKIVFIQKDVSVKNKDGIGC